MEIRKFLAQVASTIANGEFVSAKDAKAKKVLSTSEDAAWALIDSQATYNEADLTLADLALDWARGYEGDNSFLKSLRTVSALDDIIMAQTDRAAWIIPSFIRHEQEAVPEGFGADSEFVGEIGGEATFRGTVASVRMIKGKFGPKQIVTLLDKVNNVFTYWPSNRVLPLKAADSVRVFGKIKAHNVYNGVKQTVLTRAKITVVPSIA